MELSGINRLLAIAQELGVREAKSVAQPHDARREAVDDVRGRPAKSQDDPGFRVSLSAAASSLAEGIAAAPATSHAPTPNEIDPIRTQTRTSVEPSNLRRNRGVAAYQKNASANPGDRIRVIA